jgi:predicted MFS family arabinose efflux permease
LNDTLARLIGPALGGIFLEMGNLEMVVLVDMVSYVFVAVFTSFIRPPLSESNFSETDLKNVQGTFKRFLQDWREGLIFVLRDRRLKILLVVIGITTLGGTMMDPLFAPYFIEVLTLSASLFGFLLTVQGIGGILGGLVIGQFATHLRPFKLFGLGAVGSGILLFILFQNKSYGVALVLLFILGMVSVASRVGLQTLMQNATENNSRGRVFGLFGAVGASLELMGVALAGVMAELLGISFMLSLAALITLLAGSLVLVLLRPGRGVN